MELYLKFFEKFYVFIYFWLCWIFVVVQAFLELRWASFLLCWLLPLQSRGFRACRLIGCSTWPSCSMAFGIVLDQGQNRVSCIGVQIFTAESPRKLKNEILNPHLLPFCQLHLNKAVKSKILKFRLKNKHLIGLLIICNSLMSNHWRNVICEDTKISDRL